CFKPDPQKEMILKILVVAPNFNKGGAQRVISLLTLYWQNICTVRVCVFNGQHKSYDIGGEIIDLQIPATKNVFKRRFNVLTRSLKLAKILREEKPDLILSFMETANFPSILACFLSKNLDKLIVSVRTKPKALPRTTKMMIRLLYPYAKLITSNSQGSCNE